VILEVQGIPISDKTSYEQIQERLGRLHPGARITITILREGQRLELVGQLL
jgi:S1-C subfamily serine protease